MRVDRGVVVDEALRGPDREIRGSPRKNVIGTSHQAIPEVRAPRSAFVDVAPCPAAFQQLELKILALWSSERSARPEERCERAPACLHAVPGSKGSTKRAPVLAMSLTFRVKTTRPRSSAVAAISASTAGIGLCVPMCPQRSAMAWSTSMMRFLNSPTVRCSQASSTVVEAGSRLRRRSTPRRSSPTVRTLRNNSSDLCCRNQSTTRGLARSRFRSSDNTLVSTR